MATSRAGTNVFWGLITSLVAGEKVTKVRLYDEAIHRLQDNAYYVLGKVSRVYSDLISQASGGNAQIIGDVDITAFDFNSGIALNGLTIIVDEDTVAAQTCTFGNTITSPSLLLAALNSQAGTNLAWSLTDAGYLKTQSLTTGSGSTILLGAGTANTALFGSASVTSPGSSSVNDGASRIGSAAVGDIAAGTLRSILLALQPRSRSVIDYSATDGNQTISGAANEAEIVVMISAAASNRTYTMASPEADGLVKYLVRKGAGTNNVVLSGLGNAISLTFGADSRGITLVSVDGDWLVVSEWESPP